jgi:SPP1 gp7 family putative phage head morphogenesis protein
VATGEEDPEIGKLADALAKKIYKLKQLPRGIDPALTRYYAIQLWEAASKGYGDDLPSVDWDTPDYEMLYSLQRNVYQFSAAKNYHQVKALSQALTGEDGKLRTYNEFLREAFQINDQHTKQWLQAEYNLAITSGQMGGIWTRVQSNKDILPLLEFDAILDDRTTALCKSLHGVVKPVDDPFWDTYYPPNHFGCRSDVKQLGSGKITPSDKIVYPEKLPAMFKTNLAKTGLIFPPDHPYWIDIPADVKKAALLLMPYDAQFSLPKKIGKGYVREHMLAGQKGSDYASVKTVATEIAEMTGAKIDIMPVLDDVDPLRAIIVPDAKGFKNPDLRINGLLWEIKEPEQHKIKTISRAIGAATRQADHVIVKLNTAADPQILDMIAKGRFNTHKNLMEIVFRLPGGKYKRCARTKYYK